MTDNYILISPYTVQVTYQKQNSQEKETCFYFTDKISSFQKSMELNFIEKFVSGYSNIFETIFKAESIYFTLPESFDTSNILSFIKDFLRACAHANPSFIVFDRSRCSTSSISDKKKLILVDHIEQVFLKSELPVISIKENPIFSERNNINHCNITSCVNLKSINKEQVSSIRKLSKTVHQIFDLKNKMFPNFQHLKANNKAIHPNKKEKTFKHTYTLN